MKLSADELKLFTAERGDYKKLLEEISRPRQIKNKGFGITCIGNAGGSDSICKGSASGGVLIQFNDRNIIVDPGENSLSFLTATGFDPYNITDVVASHSHNDHIGDLSSVISSALQINLVSNQDTNILVPPSLVDYKNAEATCYGFTLPAYAWQGNVKILYWKSVVAERYDGELIESVKSASIGEQIQVSSAEAKHSEMPAGGFIFNTSFGKVGYTGDTEYFPGLVKQYLGVDLLWMNINTLGIESMTDNKTEVPLEDLSVKNHLGYMGVCQLIEKVRPKTAIISHFGSQLSTQVEKIQTLLRRRFAALETNIYCAQTGDRFSFDHSLRQKPALGMLS